MRLEVLAWKEASPPTEPALRQQLLDEGFEVFYWQDPEGTVYQPHSHDHDESLWVIEGEMTFGVGGRTLQLHAGDRLMLPKGTVHTAHAGMNGATYLIGERV
jgi:quercetin dioxygenase-like cupin family protein